MEMVITLYNVITISIDALTLQEIQEIQENSKLGDRPVGQFQRGRLSVKLKLKTIDHHHLLLLMMMTMLTTDVTTVLMNHQQEATATTHLL